jgi:hypothetical protein
LRLGLVLTACLAACALAPGVSSAATVSYSAECCFFPPSVSIDSDPGEGTRLVVEALGGQPGSIGATQVVVTSEAGSLRALGCTSLGPNAVTCGDPASLAGIKVLIFNLSSGTTRVVVTPDSAPLYQTYRTGPGNDVISTGPFAGSPRYKSGWLGSSLGAGRDRIEWGPRPAGGEPFSVWLEDGDDTAIAGDASTNYLDCGTGRDRVVAAEQTEAVDCERRVSSAP